MGEHDTAPNVYPKTPGTRSEHGRISPNPRDFHGIMFWRSRFDLRSLGRAASKPIRDWNLRGRSGAFNRDETRNRQPDQQPALTVWSPNCGVPTGKSAVMGDVVLNQETLLPEARDFGRLMFEYLVDRSATLRKKQYAEKFPDNPFHQLRLQTARVDRNYGYPGPVIVFYSRNIDILSMLGDASASHTGHSDRLRMKTSAEWARVVGKPRRSANAERNANRERLIEFTSTIARYCFVCRHKPGGSSLDGTLSFPDERDGESAGPNGPMPVEYTQILPASVNRHRDVPCSRFVDPKHRPAWFTSGWSYRYGLPELLGDSPLFTTTLPEARAVTDCKSTATPTQGGETVPVTVAIAKSSPNRAAKSPT